MRFIQQFPLKTLIEGTDLVRNDKNNFIKIPIHMFELSLLSP